MLCMQSGTEYWRSAAPRAKAGPMPHPDSFFRHIRSHACLWALLGAIVPPLSSAGAWVAPVFGHIPVGWWKLACSSPVCAIGVSHCEFVLDVVPSIGNHLGKLLQQCIYNLWLSTLHWRGAGTGALSTHLCATWVDAHSCLCGRESCVPLVPATACGRPTSEFALSGRAVVWSHW